MPLAMLRKAFQRPCKAITNKCKHEKSSKGVLNALKGILKTLHWSSKGLVKVFQGREDAF